MHVIYEHCRGFLRTKVGIKTTPDKGPMTSEDAGEIKYLTPHQKVECFDSTQAMGTSEIFLDQRHRSP